MSKWAHFAQTYRVKNLQQYLIYKKNKSIQSCILGENWVVRCLPIHWALF